MKRVLLILVTVLLVSACGRRSPAPLSADAPADNVPNIIGEYALNANYSNGDEYGGSLFITAGDAPNEYKLQWMISGGIHEGTGTLTGNQLTFTWKSLTEADPGLTGTGSYTVTVNGELYGPRYIDGLEEPGQETAYPNPK